MTVQTQTWAGLGGPGRCSSERAQGEGLEPAWLPDWPLVQPLDLVVVTWRERSLPRWPQAVEGSAWVWSPGLGSVGSALLLGRAGLSPGASVSGGLPSLL